MKKTRSKVKSKGGPVAPEPSTKSLFQCDTEEQLLLQISHETQNCAIGDNVPWLLTVSVVPGRVHIAVDNGQTPIPHIETVKQERKHLKLGVLMRRVFGELQQREAMPQAC